MLLAIAFILSIGFFVFSPREAWAKQITQTEQQHPVVQQQPTVTTQYTMGANNEVSGSVANTSSVQTFQGETSSAGPDPTPASKPAPDSASNNSNRRWSHRVEPTSATGSSTGSEPAPASDPTLQSGSTSGATTQGDPGVQRYTVTINGADAKPLTGAPPGEISSTGTSQVGLEPAPVPNPAAGRDPEPEPTIPADPPQDAPSVAPATPGPIVSEEDNLLPSYAGETPLSEVYTVPDAEDEEPSPLPPRLETTVNSMVGNLDSTVNALQNFAGSSLFRPGEDETSIVTTLMNLFFGEVLDHTPTSDHTNTSEPAPSSPDDPSKDMPLPLTPPTSPAGNSSFSLSGGSQTGLGGFALLLLCVLVSGLVVLRRDSKLSWTFCDLPKPSSALLLPLERPG